MDVEASIKSHNTDGFGLARFGNNSKTTYMTFGREFVVKVFYAVDLVGGVDRERNSVQRLAADDADKAGRMVGLTRRTQDPVGDGFRAN